MDPSPQPLRPLGYFKLSSSCCCSEKSAEGDSPAKISTESQRQITLGAPHCWKGLETQARAVWPKLLLAHQPALSPRAAPRGGAKRGGSKRVKVYIYILRLCEAEPKSK